MNTNKTIYFDMDGTIADLYAVNNWLPKLQAGDPAPYAEAKPMVKLNTLARKLNTLQRNGYKLGIVSWLCKGGSYEYNKQVTATKQKWLNTHLKSVKWDEIHIVKYGTPKHKIVNNPQGILFDDEERNRKAWTGIAYDEKEILKVLKNVS